jgi:hypothetical protein
VHFFVRIANILSVIEMSVGAHRLRVHHVCDVFLHIGQNLLHLAVEITKLELVNLHDSLDTILFVIFLKRMCMQIPNV